MRAHHPLGHIAGHIARSLILLIAGFVLFVDDDNAHVFHRGEQRAAGAYHHTGTSFADKIPLVEALTLRHAGMQYRHRVAETTTKAGNRLRRQRNLGNQYNSASALHELIFDGAQVHLGLTRSGNAINQHHMPVLFRGGAGYSGKRFFLMGSKHRPLPRPLGKRSARLVAFAHTSAMLNADNALLFKRFQRGRNRSVFSRKLCNAQIALPERLQHEFLLNGTLARLEFICFRSARHPTLVDLGNHGSRYLPGTVNALHARHTAGRHEQAYARRKRRKVTIRQELRTLGANLSKARLAQHLFYGLELRGIKAVGSIRAQTNHETHGFTPPKGNQHRATNPNGRAR